MTKKLKAISFYFSLFIFLMTWVSVPASAEEKKLDKIITTMWVFFPKAGKSADFEKAFKKHLVYRKSMDDPRKWSVYQADMGPQMNAYLVRACCDSWSDLDDYRQWSIKSKATENWRENVSEYIAHYERNRSEADFKNSHWPEDVKYKYVGVNTYKLKLGHREALAKDKQTLSDAAKSENWPYNWFWDESINGKMEMNLAIPYMNYGAMAPPEIKFSEMLAKHLDDKEKAKEVLSSWSSHFKSVSYNVYVLREDLSM